GQLDPVAGGVLVGAEVSVHQHPSALLHVQDHPRGPVDGVHLPAEQARGHVLGDGDLDRGLLADLRPAHGTGQRAGPAPSAAPAFASASRMAPHTRSDVSGRSRWRIPRWESASITAFWTAGVDPMVAASPIPLA